MSLFVLSVQCRNQFLPARPIFGLKQVMQTMDKLKGLFIKDENSF